MDWPSQRIASIASSKVGNRASIEPCRTGVRLSACRRLIGLFEGDSHSTQHSRSKMVSWHRCRSDHISASWPRSPQARTRPSTDGALVTNERSAGMGSGVHRCCIGSTFFGRYPRPFAAGCLLGWFDRQNTLTSSGNAFCPSEVRHLVALQADAVKTFT